MMFVIYNRFVKCCFCGQVKGGKYCIKLLYALLWQMDIKQQQNKPF